MTWRAWLVLRSASYIELAHQRFIPQAADGARGIYFPGDTETFETP